MATLGFSKVFILDKYFSSLYKFWEAEKRLQQGMQQDGGQSGEEAHLEQELRALRSRLVTLGHQIRPRGAPCKGRSDYVNQPQQQQQLKEPPRPPATPLSDGGRPSASVMGTRTNTTPSEATPSETDSFPRTELATIKLAEVEDLIHTPGALTEDALIRCIQARVGAGTLWVRTGPVTLLLNPLTHTANLTLKSVTLPPPPPLAAVVREAHRLQAETGYPQAIILSGASGAGKTLTSMLVVKELFRVATQAGLESDTYRHLEASISVLRSLGTARTTGNLEGSRIGHFIEAQITEGSVYRARVHCYLLDQSRVVRPRPEERNYHIFYQMLAGLSPEEKGNLHLDQERVDTLRYLHSEDNRFDALEEGRRFAEWKAALALLGIPLADVLRILAAVLLLGNVDFAQGTQTEVVVKSTTPLQSAAALLGVSPTALRTGLTTRTTHTPHHTPPQLIHSKCTASYANTTRDSLAKSLYTRTVATIVRRANSTRRFHSGTLSSDSADSVSRGEALSQAASTVGTAGSRVSKSMAALNNAVRQMDSWIGILDMFGFEDLRPSRLEQLCVNLCAETMQHFYNTHIFKASIEACHDEGITTDWELDYVDNVPCIDLISSLRTGLLSMLDVECSLAGTTESYVEKLHAQHKDNPRLLSARGSREFAIQHYAGKVFYDATDFMDTNRDLLPDDLVAAFHKHSCQFGFASHLFSAELKVLGQGGREPCPRGISFRVSPTTSAEMLNGDEPVSTLTQDFHTRLDNLLRTLVHSKPHFVRCLRLNSAATPDLFDRHTISKQLRAFQVLETVNLMANGYPHRLRFKFFNARYRLLVPGLLGRMEDPAAGCAIILDWFGGQRRGVSWAMGRRHVFVSESTRQQLEALRTRTREAAATLIQSTYRGWRSRRAHPKLRRPRPAPIMGTPPPELDADGEKLLRETSLVYGVDLDHPPPLPPSRRYTISGGGKFGFPQKRTLRMDWSVVDTGAKLAKGEVVLVVRPSTPRRGHLVVDHKRSELHVPHQYLQFGQQLLQ